MNPYDPKHHALRDEFAREAMKALLAAGFGKLEFDLFAMGADVPDASRRSLAIRSYTIADAMMKARELT